MKNTCPLCGPDGPITVEMRRLREVSAVITEQSSSLLRSVGAGIKEIEVMQAEIARLKAEIAYRDEVIEQRNAMLSAERKKGHP